MSCTYPQCAPEPARRELARLGDKSTRVFQELPGVKRLASSTRYAPSKSFLEWVPQRSCGSQARRSHSQPGKKLFVGTYATPSALHQEMLWGDVFGIECCAAQGVSMNCRFPDGSGPPLVEAAMRSRLDLVRQLLQLRADVALVNAAGLSPLAAAVGAGDSDSVREILAHLPVGRAWTVHPCSSKVQALSPMELAHQRCARARQEREAAAAAFVIGDPSSATRDQATDRTMAEAAVTRAEAKMARSECVLRQLKLADFKVIMRRLQEHRAAKGHTMKVLAQHGCSSTFLAGKRHLSTLQDARRRSSLLLCQPAEAELSSDEVTATTAALEHVCKLQQGLRPAPTPPPPAGASVAERHGGRGSAGRWWLDLVVSDAATPPAPL